MTQASRHPQQTPQSPTQNRIPELCKQLKLLLSKDLVALDSLKSTLDAESVALKQRESEKIASLAKTKAALVKEIEDRARSKVKLITASGAPISAGKVNEGINTLGDTQLSELWTSALEKLSECKELNQINGLVIERSRIRNQKIIDIVRGSHKKPKLYGNKGGEQSYATSSRIAKA